MEVAHLPEDAEDAEDDYDHPLWEVFPGVERVRVRGTLNYIRPSRAILNLAYNQS